MMPIVTPVIVTYNPNIEILYKNISILTEHPFVTRVVVVDNSSIDFNFKFDIPNLHVIKLGTNMGIATAQNAGIDFAKKLESNFVLLLDQDSYVEEFLLNYLVDGFLLASQSEKKVAAVGPRTIDVFSGKIVRPRIQKEVCEGDNITFCKQIIASGKLINMKFIDDIGVMEDELFIDGVDHEWCWRAISKGYSIAIIEDALMKHTLGDSRINILFYSFRVGTPLRMYYQIRNYIFLSQRSYVPIYWKLRNLIGFIIKPLVFISDANRKERYIKMYEGIVDGFNGVYGKYKR